jgi:hypothetical protein
MFFHFAFFRMLILALILSLTSTIARLPPGGSYSTSGAPRPDAINVHMVCHSHNGVGWLLTADEYFKGTPFAQENVTAIYDSVFAELQKNPSRKFVVVEIYFFSRWWAGQGLADQAIFKSLVEQGRVSFLNGVWVMNDEATNLFSDMNDQMALGVMRACAEKGIAIPGQLSVVGFDDTADSAWFSPPLTTIRQAFREAGERSVEWLLAPSGGEACRQVQLPVTLVTRHSSARRNPKQAEREDLAQQLRSLALLAEQIARK